MTLQRVQLSRKKGYRKPEGAVVVARPTKWGNPFRVVRMWDGPGWKVQGNGTTLWSADDAPWTKAEASAHAVAIYRERYFIPGSAWAADVRTQLGGKDLCCWCPEGQPCHADVLLELANPGSQTTEGAAQ